MGTFAHTNIEAAFETVLPLRKMWPLLLLALLSACGSNVTPRSNALYSGSGPTSTVLLDGNGAAEAQCSAFDSSTTRLGGKVTTYYYNGVLQDNKVRVRITSLLAAFDTNTNYYIQAFRWKMTGGVADIDSTAVQFQFEKGAGSDQPISPLVSSLSLQAISAYRTGAGISGTGSVDFFSKTTMVVNDVDFAGGWSALQLVIYDGSTSPATVVGKVDFLIPIFQANPLTYASTHSPTLAQLHPFASQSSLVLSETEWANRTTSFCF